MFQGRQLDESFDALTFSLATFLLPPFHRSGPFEGHILLAPYSRSARNARNQKEHIPVTALRYYIPRFQFCEEASRVVLAKHRRRDWYFWN
jgi:hypothetical protein